jgi:hypothetical protein
MALRSAAGWLAVLNVLLAATGRASADTILYVGDYFSHEVRRFDSAGNPIPPIPFISTGYQVEAIRCTTTYLYVADNTNGLIHQYNRQTGALMPFTVVPGHTFAGIDGMCFSPDGRYLYVAETTTGQFDRIDLLSNIIDKTLSFPSAYDIRVAPDGSVYVDAAGAIPQKGIWHYDAAFNLIGSGALIPGNDVQGGLTLNQPTGLALDAKGNLWVANADADASKNFIREYNSSGAFVRQVANPTSGTQSGFLYVPFGIDFGPNGDLFAAVFGTNRITEISATNLALSSFISPPDAGNGPKFPAFESNCVADAAPEPSSLLLAASAGLVALVSKLRRRGKIADG